MSKLLSTALAPNLIRVNLHGTTKEDVIRELLELLDQAGRLPDRREAERVVFERERLLSTVFENGIALPHGKTDSVPGLVAALGTKPAGIACGAPDQQPTKIFLLLLSPASNTGPHIRFLAELTHLLADAVLRAAVVGARTGPEILRLLTDAARV